MRDYVEIGIGREARKAYRLGDISLVPSRRTRSSSDVDTSWHIDAYTFDMPLVAHPTDALASPEFVIEMGKRGGLGVLNAEGILARHASFEEAVSRVVGSGVKSEVADSDYSISEFRRASRDTTAALQELHAAPLDHDLLSERIAQVRDAGVTVAVRVSPQNARELAPVVIKAGAELLFIQGTVISAEYVKRGGEPLDLKEFIGSLEVPVIAGAVYDYTTATHLMRLRRGGRHRRLRSGIELPLGRRGSAHGHRHRRRRCSAPRVPRRDGRALRPRDCRRGDSQQRGCRRGDRLRRGRRDAWPAACPGRGSGGQGYYWESAAAHPRYPRGSVEPYDLFGKRIPLERVLHGPAAEPNGTTNVVGGLRRIMAKCGYTDIKSFQKVGLTVQR